IPIPEKIGQSHQLSNNIPNVSAMDSETESVGIISNRLQKYEMIESTHCLLPDASQPPSQQSNGDGPARDRQAHLQQQFQRDAEGLATAVASPAAFQYPNPWVRRSHPTPPPSASQSEGQQLTVAAGGTPSLFEIVRQNFINYCQTTSLRGVPKIVKTRDRLLRHIWILFTCTFFLGCFTCLALIIKQYLAYDVIHQPRTVRNHPVQFPSFTVCNTRPFSQAGIQYILDRGLVLPKNYSQFVMQAMRNTAENQRGVGFNDTTKEALSTIFETKGYFENVPRGFDIARLGHTIDQTILICETTILDKDFKRSKFCETIGTWTRTYDNKFLNCYTFTADANNTQKILTVRIMAYTNERNLTNCPDCSSFPATQVSGLRVQLHNAGNYPEVQEEGLNIRPGSLTEIRFETKEWVMKEPPHGRCSTRVPPSVLFNGDAFTYSYQACKKKLLHEEIMKKCGCLDSTIPLPDSMRNTGLDFCGRIPPSQFSLQSEYIQRHNHSTPHDDNDDQRKRPSFHFDADFNDFLRRLTCNTAVFKVSGHATAHQCFTPCTYYTYQTTISTTNWPTRAYHYEIVNDFKNLRDRIDNLHRRGKISRNSSYLDPVFQRLQRIYGPLSEADSPAEAERMLRGIDYIERNFIEILINRGKSNFDIERIEEKAVISLTSLLSQIGGLLSIWVGLTFVCIVEIVDLLYNICVSYNGSRQAA
ncbi:hypothetical protein BOX15_Mlig022967g2, partial [Macrostomum lignano]